MGKAMKNTDCVIYITTKRGRTWSYLKEINGWTQTGPTGIVHRLSVEQLLSHLLPPLVADNSGHLSVRVERRVAALAAYEGEKKPNHGQL
jgi:hypothetical protein